MSSPSPAQAGAVMVKMFTIAVDGIDPTSIFLTIVEDVAKAICSGIVNLIKENQEFANPPSGVQYNSDIYVFYQSGTNLYYGLWNGSTWTTGNQVPGVTTSCGPGAVVFNNTIYVFYQGASNNGQLWYVTFNETTGWSSSSQVPTAAMSYSPSAAVLNNTLYVFYQGSGNNQKLYYATSSDGSSWSNQNTQIPSPNMSCSPAATTYNNELYVFFQGENDCSELWYVTSSDGSSWTENVQITTSNVSLVGSPSAVVYNGQICVIYTNKGYGNSLWYTAYNGSWSVGIGLAPLGLSVSPSTAVFTPPGGSPQLYYMCQGIENTGVLWCNVFNGTNWIATSPVSDSVVMSQSPGTVVFNNTLYCFYQGQGENGELWYNTSTDGSTWSSGSQVPGVSLTDSPAPVVFNGTLYVFYQGGGNADYLYYITLNGSTWSSPQRSPCDACMWNSPSPVVFNNKLYIFFMGSSNNSVIWYLTYDGTNWKGCTSISGSNTSDSPSAVVFNGQIYLFYLGSNNTGYIDLQIYNGTTSTWSLGNIDTPADVVTAPMSNSPSAVVFQDTLYMLYQAQNLDQWSTGGNGLLAYFTCNSAGQWNYVAPPNPTSPQSPAGVVVSLTQDEWDALKSALGDL